MLDNYKPNGQKNSPFTPVYTAIWWPCCGPCTDVCQKGMIYYQINPVFLFPTEDIVAYKDH